MPTGIVDEALKAGKISAISNLVLTLLKLIAGLLTNSTALVADAIHSLVDVLGSLLVWIGLKIAEKPADEKHPYGHFKAESLAELSVGLIILFSSVYILHEAITSLLLHSVPEFEMYAAGIALLSAAVNELLARYKIEVGLKTRSSSLIAEGKHSRVDVISSLSVVVGLILVYFGYWWADSVVAIAISIIILQIGAEVLKNSLDVLMDKVDEEVIVKVMSVMDKISGVESVEFVATRGTWKSRIVEVHFTVNAGMDADTIDAIEREIAEEIKDRVPGVVDVVAVVRVSKPRVLAIPIGADGKYTGELDSPMFVIVNLDSGEIKRIENMHYGAEKKKGLLISELLEEYGVSIVAVKKIGEGAKAHFKSRGIIVRIVNSNIREVDEVVRAIGGKDSIRQQGSPRV